MCEDAGAWTFDDTGVTEMCDDTGIGALEDGATGTEICEETGTVALEDIGGGAEI
jgi:hypothetical protein